MGSWKLQTYLDTYRVVNFAKATATNRGRGSCESNRDKFGDVGVVQETRHIEVVEVSKAKLANRVMGIAKATAAYSGGRRQLSKGSRGGAKFPRSVVRSLGGEGGRNATTSRASTQRGDHASAFIFVACFMSIVERDFNKGMRTEKAVHRGLYKGLTHSAVQNRLMEVWAQGGGFD